jgi:glycosyltransferase involved in cell wall biosynthesis
MTMLAAITPLILTWNEAPNIGRTLQKLTWAKRIVVVDSFSTDETEAICRQFPQVEFVQRRFVSFADQCNFGLGLIRTPWVLSLDADYVLSDGLVAELERLAPGPEAGYSARFVYCVHGRPLRGSLYPPRTVLYRREGARYRDDGHCHRVQLEGAIGRLRGVIYHDDRKSLSRWLLAQDRYATLEAQKLVATPKRMLSRPDRLRRLVWLAPGLVFFYTLLGKGLLFEGWRGWYYVFERTLAETLLALRLIEARFAARETMSGPRGC